MNAYKPLVYNFKIPGKGRGFVMVVNDLELVIGGSISKGQERIYGGSEPVVKQLNELRTYNKGISTLVKSISDSSVLVKITRDDTQCYFLIPNHKEPVTSEKEATDNFETELKGTDYGGSQIETRYTKENGGPTYEKRDINNHTPPEKREPKKSARKKRRKGRGNTL